MTEKKQDPVRAFLGTVREARVEEARCRRKLQEIDAQCRTMTASLNGMPHGGSGDPHKDSPWAALADQRRQHEALLAAAVRQEMKVERFIARMRTDSYRIILKLRYVDLLGWPRIQEQLEQQSLNYSDRQIYRLHGEALQEARQIWTELHREETAS